MNPDIKGTARSKSPVFPPDSGQCHESVHILMPAAIQLVNSSHLTLSSFLLADALMKRTGHTAGHLVMHCPFIISWETQETDKQLNLHSACAKWSLLFRRQLLGTVFDSPRKSQCKQKVFTQCKVVNNRIMMILQWNTWENQNQKMLQAHLWVWIE